MAAEDLFVTFPHLETPRLNLRQIQASDTPAIFVTFSDPQTMEFLGEEPLSSLEDAHEHVRALDTWYARREGIRWGITRRGDSADEVIGSCGLFRFDDTYTRAEVGYELRRAYWRQGIMTEALGALLDYAFVVLRLHRVEAVVDEGNTRSRGLLSKLGFTHEGTLRQRFFFRERFWDESYFGLLRAEWQRTSESG